MASNVRVRRSLNVVYAEYLQGNRTELETLMKAFREISKLPASDKNSFFLLGGYHGQPFRGHGDTSINWWGGYCNHNNVLFPTWHRAYLQRLEDALRSVPGCQDVTLPYWDETFDMEKIPKTLVASEGGVPKGPLVPELPAVRFVPEIFTQPTVAIDNVTQANPLYSYSLVQAIEYQAAKDNRYTKPVGYNTVRYPLSGLVGTKVDAGNTEVWNSSFSQEQQTSLLNSNVGAWLTTDQVFPPDIPVNERPSDTTSVQRRFRNCLNAPNYTVFSNLGSQTSWNQAPDTKARQVMSLESPHNSIHLALGGFWQPGNYIANPQLDGRKANGDMGANEMAGFDPIFYFHHCYIDYVFWKWQERNSLTQKGDLTVDYSITGGTTIVTKDTGYPLAENIKPPGDKNARLTMTTPLHPFIDPSTGQLHTSETVTNIKDLGYTYGPGSLDLFQIVTPSREAIQRGTIVQRHVVSKINRANYEGSFVIRTYALLPSGEEAEVGREPILSRWRTLGCQNCEDKLDIESVIAIDQATSDLLGGADREVELRVEIQEIHRTTSTTYPSRRGFRDAPNWSDLVGEDGPPEPEIGHLD